MRIGELAAATDASPIALRHYEQEGLITSESAANGYRVYAPRCARPSDPAANVRVKLPCGPL